MSLEIRKTLSFSEEMWADVSDWRWRTRINTESDSIRNLLAAGLHYYKLMEDPQFVQAEGQAAERMANADAR
jgi:hypothetical protein